MRRVWVRWGGALRSGRGGPVCLALAGRLARTAPPPVVAVVLGAWVWASWSAVGPARARVAPRRRPATTGMERSAGGECFREGAEVAFGVVAASSVVVVEDAEHNLP